MNSDRKAGAVGRGKWAVERERFQLGDSRPPHKQREGLPIGEIVSTLMTRLGMEDQHWLRTLEQEWAALIGRTVAGHTRPGRFERNRLTVFVDSSVWLSELSRYGRDALLAKLQARFGAQKVQSVSLEMDPGDREGAGEARSLPARKGEAPPAVSGEERETRNGGRRFGRQSGEHGWRGRQRNDNSFPNC